MSEARSGKPADEIKATAGLSVGRRHALQLLGSFGIAGGVAASTACHSGHETASGISAQTVPRTLAEPEFALLSRLTALIIPKTDTEGALEARVPDFIDASLPAISSAQLAAMTGSADVFWDNPAILFADGLRWIDDQAITSNGKGFLQLDEGLQMRTLEAAYAEMEASESSGRNTQFLRALKAMTVHAYYTSQVGLINELGYKGNTPRQMSELDCKNAKATP
jgi:hypothetical protein